jgi:hypothetical protein
MYPVPNCMLNCMPIMEQACRPGNSNAIGDMHVQHNAPGQHGSQPAVCAQIAAGGCQQVWTIVRELLDARWRLQPQTSAQRQRHTPRNLQQPPSKLIHHSGPVREALRAYCQRMHTRTTPSVTNAAGIRRGVGGPLRNIACNGHLQFTSIGQAV